MFIRHKERNTESHPLCKHIRDTPRHRCTPPHTPKCTESHTQDQDHKRSPTCTPHAQTRSHRALPGHPNAHIHRTHTYQAGADAGAAESPTHSSALEARAASPPRSGRGGACGRSSQLPPAGILLAPPPALRRSFRMRGGREETPFAVAALSWVA